MKFSIVGFAASIILSALASVWLLAVRPADVLAQNAGATLAPQETATSAGAPVIVDGKVLFTLRERIGSITPSERAEIVSRRIQDLVSNPFRRDVVISTVDSDAATDIVAGDRVLLTVTDTDAAANGKPRQLLAQERADAIMLAIEQARSGYSLRAVLFGSLYALLATVVAIALFKLVNWLYALIIARIRFEPGPTADDGSIHSFLSHMPTRLSAALIVVTRAARVALWLATLAIYFPLVLSLFPWTRAIGRKLLGNLLSPLASLWESFVEYLPDLFFLLVVAAIAWLVIKLARFIFLEIERGTIKIAGFQPEWAMFTYKIAAFLILVGSLVVAFPYLPGSESPAFKGVTIFLGVLFSLSSSSAISNIIAGVILTYTGAFRLGDRVKVGSVTGDVIAKKLLVTTLRTIKNEEVSIPNSVALSNEITNYSALARTHGLILHTAVTIGYNAPWQQVHELLIQAALSSHGILQDPAPFVLQTSLNDYHVTYEINAYTNQPLEMVNTYSSLHQQIQDKFNEAGVEIMSPAYASLRDGNQITIPEHHLPMSYQAPAFRFTTEHNSTHDEAELRVTETPK